MSTKGRYAVLAMIDLAQHSQTHPIPLPQIASRLAISQHYLEQLFVKMRRAKLVKSTRGPGGGYILALPPSEITMKAVLSAVEETIRPVDCGEEVSATPCPSIAVCGSRLLWQKLETAIDQTLTETTLEDLSCGPAAESGDTLRLPSFPVSI
ncbi:MAG: Rrf2 family transcriptional regulator [bacterium]